MFNSCFTFLFFLVIKPAKTELYNVTAGFGGPNSIGTSFIFGWHSDQAILFANTFSNNAHTAQVNALKLINSTHLASGSDDKTIKIWDFTTLKCTLTLNTPNNENVLSLALLKNNFLASGCDGANKIYIWNLDISSLVATLTGHSAKVNTLEVLNDGILASGGADNTVRLWNSGDYSLLYTYSTTAAVNCLRQLTNGCLAMALNSGPNNLIIWDPVSKAVNISFGPHSSFVRAVEELNSGYIVTGADSGNVRLWNLRNTNTAVSTYSHTERIKVLKSMTNGILASASDDNTIKIWNSTSFILVRDLRYPLDINYNALEVGIFPLDITTTTTTATTTTSTTTTTEITTLESTFASLLTSTITSTTETTTDTTTSTADIISTTTSIATTQTVTTTTTSTFMPSSSLFSSTTSSSTVETTTTSFSTTVYSSTSTITTETTSESTSTTSTSSTSTPPPTTTTTTNNPTSPTTTKSIASVLNETFSFSELSNTQTVELLTSNYDMSSCLSNCSNNGVCEFVNSKFVCSCFSAYLTGAACQLDTRPCLSSPCLNNATCVDFTNANGYNMSSIFGANSTDFSCLCDKYHQGSYCESEINICQNETCSGNGNCVDLNNQAKCECFNMYLGEKCDTQSTELKTIKTVISFTSIIAIIIVILFYACFIIMDLTKFCSRKNKRKNRVRSFNQIEFL